MQAFVHSFSRASQVLGFLFRTVYFMFTWRTWFRMLLYCYLVNRALTSASCVQVRSKTHCWDSESVHCAIPSPSDRDTAVQLKALVPIFCVRQRWRKHLLFSRDLWFPCSTNMLQFCKSITQNKRVRWRIVLTLVTGYSLGVLSYICYAAFPMQLWPTVLSSAYVFS